MNPLVVNLASLVSEEPIFTECAQQVLDLNVFGLDMALDIFLVLRAVVAPRRAADNAHAGDG